MGYSAAMRNFCGRAIARIRLAKDVKLLEFADKLGVSAPAVLQWESGLRPFPEAHLEAAAEALRVPVETLMTAELPVPTRELGRRPVLRPAYPCGATLDQLARLSPSARALVDRVRAHLTEPLLRLISEDWPRDTVHELRVALCFLDDKGGVELASTGHYRCPEHTMHDLDDSVGDHLLQPAITWARAEERIVLFSQIWLNVLRYGPIRVDFMIYYRRKGRTGYWLILEIDDRSSHTEKTYRDEARALALTLPVLRYENHVVHQPWFFERLLKDVRNLESETARRRRERHRRARRLNQDREARAAERRAA